MFDDGVAGAAEVDEIGACDRVIRVAQARQVSASAAAHQFGFALGLRAMTQTREAFASGVVSERVAKAVVDEVGGLSPVDAAKVDRELAPDLFEVRG